MKLEIAELMKVLSLSIQLFLESRRNLVMDKNSYGFATFEAESHCCTTFTPTSSKSAIVVSE